MATLTDGSMTGKVLSLQEIYKTVGELPTKDDMTAAINAAITNLLNSGDVAVAPNKTMVCLDTTSGMSGTGWKDKTITAPVSGWYSLYCADVGGVSTPSAYISTYNNSARPNGNGVRDLAAGPIWVKAGQTITFGCIGFKTMKLDYTTRE